jgi:predicted porin
MQPSLVQYVQLPENGGWPLQKVGAPVQTLENLEMKKTLVAIAALAATSAFAQSSVTAYGMLDAGYSDMSREVTKQDGTLGTKEGSKAFSFSNYTSSRFGFKGTEDLGGGMKANFIIETGISGNRLSGFGQPAISSTTYKGVTASGTTLDATTIGNRELNATLQFGSTTVGAGFGGTAVRSNVLGFDPNGGTNLIGNLLTNDATLSSNRATGAGVRQQFGAFAVGAAIASNVSTLTDKDDVKTGNGYTLNLEYNQGPVAFGAVTQKTKTTVNQANSANLVCSSGTTVAGQTNSATATCASGYSLVGGAAAVLASSKETTVNLIGASYDLGAAKLFAQYGAIKTDDTAQLDAAGEGKRSAYTIGAQVPAGKWVAFGSYSKGKKDEVSSGISVSGTAGKASTSRDMTGYTLGAKYNMSKRTFAYVAVGQTKLDESNVVTSSADFGAKVKQTALGLAHSF